MTFLQTQNYWDKETEHIHKEDYYSAIKSKEVLIDASKEMNPQNITLSERNQTEEGHVFIVRFHSDKICRMDKSTETEYRLVVARGWGRRE